MPGSKGAFDPEIKKAVSSGEISLETLDAVVARNITLNLLGLSVIKRKIKVNHLQHHQLARKVAMQCAVLLKNKNNLLPLATNTSVAVIGNFAKHPRFQGMGSSQVNPTKVDCAWDRIPKYSEKATYSQGYHHESDSNNTDLIEDAVSAAKKADVALIFCGLPEIYESEGFDRKHMNMPDTHNALVDAVCSVNPQTVVILSNGAPVTMPWAEKAGAIIDGYLGGQAGGSAIVDLVFGVASPCGKLAETFPVSQEDSACHDYFPGDNQVEYREGLNVGYRYFDTAKKRVLFPFGHGLTYTSFEYSKLEAKVNDDGESVDLKFTLTNTGSVPAAEVVQCYVHDVESMVYRPEQELKAFSKVWLNPQEHEVVELKLQRNAFSFYDVGHKKWILEPGAFEIRIAASSRDIRLKAEVVISKGEEASADAQLTFPPVYDVSSSISDDRFCRMLQTDELPQPRKRVRPFSRLSLVSELKHSITGRLIRGAVFHVAIDEMDDADDPAQRRLVEELVDNMPLKGLVIFSQGTVIFEDLDTLIAMLNWNFIKAATHLIALIKRRCAKKAKPKIPLGSVLRMSLEA
jgi:beta-glucosidase